MTTATRGLVRFAIRDFRGIVELSAAPNGRSLTLRGKNSSGKSSAIDALWWGLGGALEGDVVRNGADVAESRIEYQGYTVTRRLKRGGRPVLTVKDAQQRTYGSPTQLLSEFRAAISRRTFSALPPAEQTSVLVQLAPGLDVSRLDEERELLYQERLEIGRRRDELRAAVEAMPAPEPVEAAGEEVSLAELRRRRAQARGVAQANNAVRRESEDAERAARAALGDLDGALTLAESVRQEIDRLQLELSHAVSAERLARDRANAATLAAASYAGKLLALVEPDLAELDAEEERIEAHNRQVREQLQAAAEAERQRRARQEAWDRAALQARNYEARTQQIQAIDEDKRQQLASAAGGLPVPGLGLSGKVVTFDDGRHGAVPVAALNTACRMRLDVVLAAAQGHRLVAVRDASLLDEDTRVELEAFAAAHAVQLVSEVVASGEELQAIIEEAGDDALQADTLDAVLNGREPPDGGADQEGVN